MQATADKTPANPDARSNFETRALGSVQIGLTVSVGHAHPLIRDLLRMRQGSILPLDRKVDDPVELFVGDRLIARGLLVELDGDQQGQLAVSLTEVVDLGNGF